ncbi:MAG TPA: stalk domain-containing protein [Syntrophomonas sp.]|nr:stalk domain-containing protein [Syntrophomonas sp.]
MFKRRLAKRMMMLGLCLLLVGAAVKPVGAASVSGSSDFSIYMNNEQLVIPADDQQPVIIDGRTYVPLRVISENMGAQVEWIEAERQVIILWKKTSIDIWPDSRGEDVQIIIDGKILEIPEDLGKAYISERGRTMIPLRAVGEAMDCAVDWIDASRTVEIHYERPVSEATEPIKETPPEPTDASDQDNLQMFKDLAAFRTNLKMLDGKVMNSEELLTRQPTDFSAEQLAVLQTYLSQLSKYQASITLPDGSAVNSAEVSILGDSYLTARQLTAWIEQETPRLMAKAAANGVEFKPIPDLARLYIDIGKEYGIRGDIAFCQAAKETGYWQFTGSVTPEQNNYCGLWATGSPLTGQESLNGADPEQVTFVAGLHGATFATPAVGVEAHIQHLYAYATKNSLPKGKVLVDPRFALVSKGVAPTWLQLNARWAVPGTTYGQSILTDYWLEAAK